MNKKPHLLKKIIVTFLILATLLEYPQFYEQIDNNSVSIYSLEDSDFGNLPRH